MSKVRVFSIAVLALACLAFAGGPRYGQWSAPVNADQYNKSLDETAPLVNWPDKSDQQPFISRDGLSLYFTSGRGPSMDIYVSHRPAIGEPWDTPVNLGPAINAPGLSWDMCPVLSRDGHRLFFSSNRPGGFGGQDVYVAHRRDVGADFGEFGWEPAVNLGPVVNGPGGEQPGSLFEDDATGETTLYLFGNRPGGLGGTDILAATQQPDGTFGPPQIVLELSTVFSEQGPAVRRDGLEMIFASDRPFPGALGDLDLWVSTRSSTAEPWSEPQPLIGLNSPFTENRPALSFDGTELYFNSTRDGGAAPQELYVATRSRLRGKPE